MPLSGLSIVDFGLGIPAALVVRMLADTGAHVRRAEISSGDPFYRLYPAYAVWQRDKEITHAGDLDAAVVSMGEALAQADVCVIGGEDFPNLAWRPDAEALARAYPRLVILEISAGRHGAPDAAAPAVDLLAQARSGLVYEQYSDRPMLLAMPAPSYGAALEGLVAVLAALCERERSGMGQIVRTSLFEGALSWLGHFWCQSDHTDRSMDYVTPKDVQPLIFRCADGKYVHFTLGTTNARANVYGLLGIEDPTLADDPRGLPSLARGTRNFYGDIDLLQSYVGKWRRGELLEALWALGVPAEAVNEPGGAWDDPQVIHNGTILRYADGVRRVGLPFRLKIREAAAGYVPRSNVNAGNAPPLAGVNIVDFGNFTAGPHASMILADLGADVIKVEALSRDPIRGFYRPYSTSSRGKRSLAVDLKKPGGLEIVLRLCRSADMVHHNFRPGVTERLGIGNETLRGLKPDLIILENSGYGADGPRAASGGIDMIFQAVCGHEQHAAGVGNPPNCYRSTTVDLAAGALGAIASLIAQFEKLRTGAGAAAGTSLLDTGLFLLSELVQSSNAEISALPMLNHEQTGFHPAEQLYQTRDGWIAIAARGGEMAQNLLEVLGLATKITREREAWRAAESAIIAEAVMHYDCAALLAALHAAGVWAALCHTEAEREVLNDPSLRASGTVVSSHHPRYGEVRQIGRLFSFSRSEGRVRGETASLGEDSRQILSELGYGEEEIARFYQESVVA